MAGHDQNRSCGQVDFAAGAFQIKQLTNNKTIMKTLHNLFLEELADMYDAERRVVKALPKMAKAATCPDLRATILSHLKETEGHVKKLEQVFQSFDEKAKGQTCKATVGLLEEGDEIAADFKGSPALNAALISAAQKVEHHEMASYGCLHEWAGLLGNEKAAGLLEEILNEEKAANEKLTELARAGNNAEALCECDENGSKDAAADARPASLRRGIRPVGSMRKGNNILTR
jgi:ferritin-like metal-binding protein YciE